MDDEVKAVADFWLGSPFLERYRIIGERINREMARESEWRKKAALSNGSVKDAVIKVMRSMPVGTRFHGERVP